MSAYKLHNVHTHYWADSLQFAGYSPTWQSQEAAVPISVAAGHIQKVLCFPTLISALHNHHVR